MWSMSNHVTSELNNQQQKIYRDALWLDQYQPPTTELIMSLNAVCENVYG